MTRVLHVGKYYPPRWGGMETALKDICETLAPRVDLRVVVANDAPRQEEDRSSGFHLTRLATWRTLFSQPLTPGLWRLLRRERAEIVHLHEPNPLALALFLLARHRGRLVIHYHSDIVRQRKLKWLYRPILELGLSRAGAIIAGSRELIDGSPVLARHRAKCLVIPFGIDLRPFLPLDAQARAAAPGRRVLAVGRFSYYKGFQFLIESMAHWEGELTLVGDGELRAELEATARRLGVEARVHFTGRVSQEELVRHYREADLFCLPSCERSEAFGLVMVEAMGAALPVVSTDLPTGVRAVNQHGETGLVVAPGEPSALGAAISSLLGDPERRLRMGLAGRERAVRLFSREAMAESILRLYAAVAPEAGAPGSALGTISPAASPPASPPS
ncbi:MAG: glycosyltransferase [Bryobacterales bacterium]|nr:glycosyltransferase [Bryobacterales bacterium]